MMHLSNNKQNRIVLLSLLLVKQAEQNLYTLFSKQVYFDFSRTPIYRLINDHMCLRVYMQCRILYLQTIWLGEKEEQLLQSGTKGSLTADMFRAFRGPGKGFDSQQLH